MFNCLFFILMSLILLVSLVAVYYHTESAKKDSVIKTIRDERDNLFITLQTRQKQYQQIAVLDNKHTQELTDAKTQLAALEHDVLVGKRRVQLAARCETLPATPTATRLDDAAGARLDDAVVNDYFRLRKGIEIVTQQIAGLQAYVTQVCLAQ
ncbi:lysis protein [Candidatus Fukatsuia endosymbiont of Tuberolachnus salignus]|uniref:lysis protein n=1 Tax=Candidatus Fukatsuia endosymbiont of Tuberolachnus salignus TaxID=3077957 RepID=UPI00313EB60A